VKPTDCPDLPRERLKCAVGPHDATGLGWEAYYDATPEQRASAFPEVMRDATGGTSEYGRRFARAWLDAHRAAVEAQLPPIVYRSE